MFAFRAGGVLTVIVGLTLVSTGAKACDQRFPWTCPASFEPPAVGVPVNEKPDITATQTTKRMPKVSSQGEEVDPAPPAAKPAPARKTAVRGAPAKEKAHGKTTVTDKNVMDKKDKAGPSLWPQDTFAERAWVPITTQDVANDIDLAASPPVIVTTVPIPGLKVNAAAPPPRGMAAMQAEIGAPSAPATEGAAPSEGPVSAAEVAHPTYEAATSRGEPDDMSWLRRIFLGLGGLLAVASAFRMVIG